MKRTAILAASVAGVAGLVSVAGAQEIETFDSPNQTQIGNGSFKFAVPIEGSWTAANGGSITNNPTSITVTTNATPPKNAYGTAYHNIFTQDNPGTLDISGSNTLQLDVTINSGDAGLIVDLQDGEGDFWQWYYGYGLIGSGNAAPQYPGETITELPGNRLILDMPLASPTLNNGTPFDFTQLVLFRLEDDPGSSLVNSISFNDLSAVSLNLPLTWNNASADHLWNVSGSENWSNGTGNTVYTDGSVVTFNDSNPSSTPANYAVTLNSSVSPGSVTFNNSLGNYVVSGTGGIAGSGSLTKMGSGTTTLNTVNTYSGGTNVNAGTLVVGVNGAMPNGSLSITGGTLQLGPSTGLASLTSLSISGSGTMDIANNHVILAYGATDPASSIYSLLKSGFNATTVTSATAWTGAGIDSSVAALAGNRQNYGVGYVDGADHVPGAVIPGTSTPLTSGQILIAYALYGDVNLDNLVNATDFAVFGVNFNTAQTGWDKGDFLYNGLINASDFALLGTNFGKAASGVAISLPASDWAALDAFAAANGISLPSVPEPATVGLMIVGGIGALARRQRRA